MLAFLGYKRHKLQIIQKRILLYSYNDNTGGENQYMANPLTRAFDMLSESAVGLVVFIVVLVFGGILVAELSADVTADYGANSTAANITTEGEQGLLDMSGYIGLVVLAIVFVIVLALVFLIKRQAE